MSEAGWMPPPQLRQLSSARAARGKPRSGEGHGSFLPVGMHTERKHVVNVEDYRSLPVQYNSVQPLLSFSRRKKSSSRVGTGSCKCPARMCAGNRRNDTVDGLLLGSKAGPAHACCTMSVCKVESKGESEAPESRRR